MLHLILYIIQQPFNPFAPGDFAEKRALKLVECPGGGGGTPLQEANGDVPLDEVAFSRLE